MSETKLDSETAALLASLERGLQQAARGDFARVHTPEEIKARKKAGRPAGSVQATHKQPTTLRLDEDVLARWRASGKGWQTRAAEVLAKYAPR
ncbi:MAG: BrnA antitoxin family protein [Betaproteobacteria bacterium]|nr:BrnA antitoxin family protein [Betaproteobacteria bacterium]